MGSELGFVGGMFELGFRVMFLSSSFYIFIEQLFIVQKLLQTIINKQ